MSINTTARAEYRKLFDILGKGEVMVIGESAHSSYCQQPYRLYIPRVWSDKIDVLLDDIDFEEE